ncbi:MAG: PAS domain S-box protein [Proteobacteria bacterium]|nr:PAS domain S-box protein [Pseudomonadota bacterium]
MDEKTTHKNGLMQERIQYLRENTDFVSSIFDNLIGYAIIVADFDGNIITYNEGAHQIYGYAPEEVVGKENIEIFLPEEFIKEGELEHIISELIGNGSFSYEGEKVKKDGSRFPSHSLFTLAKDKSDQIAGFVEIVQDLTAQKHAENSIKAGEDKLRRIIETNTDSIMIVDGDGVIHFVNPAAETLFARPKEELLGSCFGFPTILGEWKETDIVRPASYENVLAEMRIADIEWDGEKAYLAMFHDITALKNAEMLLRQKQEEQQILLDAIPAMIFYKNTENRFVRINRALAKASAMTVEQMEGKTCFELFPDLAEKYWSDDKEVMAAGVAKRDIIEPMQTPYGTIWVKTDKIPYRNAKDGITGIIGCSIDITALKNAEDELELKNIELAKSNKELDDFAYIASHDLREPLRGIINYCSFLMEDYGDKLDADGRSKLETLIRLSNHQEKLIQSLLEYSRVGRVELAVENVDLNTVIAHTIESVRAAFQDGDINILVPRPLPEVLCDRVRIYAVFSNLITNALKYNDKPKQIIEVGYITQSSAPIEARHKQSVKLKDNSHRIFYVKDNGIGIKENHLDKIFTIFKRLHAKDKYGGGTGIGLTIVKKIIELHHGRLWAESTFGEGTTFYFTLHGDDE